MTPQEIFDKTVRHLASMKGPAMRDNSRAYRGEDGARCAVGIWIPDDKYSIDMENRGFINPVALPEAARPAYEPLWNAVPEFIRANSDLVRDLQSTHDVQPPEGWVQPELKDELLRLAHIYNLSGDVVREVFP